MQKKFLCMAVKVFVYCDLCMAAKVFEYCDLCNMEGIAWVLSMNCVL